MPHLLIAKNLITCLNKSRVRSALVRLGKYLPVKMPAVADEVSNELFEDFTVYSNLSVHNYNLLPVIVWYINERI